jgi:hypothetical protein
MSDITSNALESLVEAHIRHLGDDMIMSSIDDAKEDYLEMGWDEEYDSAEEAYAEQGHGEAECQVLMEHAQDILGRKASMESCQEFMQEMAVQLGVSIN